MNGIASIMAAAPVDTTPDLDDIDVYAMAKEAGPLQDDDDSTFDSAVEQASTMKEFMDWVSKSNGVYVRLHGMKVQLMKIKYLNQLKGLAEVPQHGRINRQDGYDVVVVAE